MKFLLPLCSITVIVLSAISSCEKDTIISSPPGQVQFVLYTDNDHSTDNNTVTFQLLIQNESKHTLWDSVLSPMKVKDIPGFANKLVFQKSVPDNATPLLRVGFNYTIENIGHAGHFDTFQVGSPLKIVNFNF